MPTEKQKIIIVDVVNAASAEWQSAFNSGDAIGCTNQYEETAIMHAKPFGTFTGHDEIKSFWQKLIEDGFSNIEYLEPKIKVIDARSAILTSNWKMNKAHGVIHKELWILQEDETAKLREDYFEALN